MRWKEIVNEASMSDVAALMQNLKAIRSANADYDLDNQQVTLRFNIDGEHGIITLSPKSSADQTKKFRSKLYAAAMAMMKGKHPKSWESMMNAIKGTIYNRAIRILTNTSEWKIDSLRYDNINF
jgi:hypothetical protein